LSPPADTHLITTLDFSKTKGAALLTSALSTTMDLSSGPHSSHLKCGIPNYTSASLTHVLVFRSSSDPGTILLPSHGLLWGATSKSLSFLSGGFSTLPTTSRTPVLPVVEIYVPNLAAIHILQEWVYHASTAHLLSRLLPPPPNKHQHLSTIYKLLNPTNLTLSSSLSNLPRSTLVDKIHAIHSLWQRKLTIPPLGQNIIRCLHLAGS
jgi:hypothetical protein